MRRTALLVCIAVLLQVTSACRRWYVESLSFEQRTVIRVIDGDTIVLNGGEKVRLLGIDSPESVDRHRPVQCFGKESAKFLASIVLDNRVRLSYDRTRKDRYGRTLAYLYLLDGTLVNETMVRQGYAFAYQKYKVAEADRLEKAEFEARMNGRGLWGVPCGDVMNLDRLETN